MHPDQIIHAGLGLAVLILAALNLTLRKELTTMSEAMTALLAAITTVETTNASTLAEVAALKAQVATLQASGEDPEALAAATARLKAISDAQTAALASA